MEGSPDLPDAALLATADTGNAVCDLPSEPCGRCPIAARTRSLRLYTKQSPLAAVRQRHSAGYCCISEAVCFLRRPDARLVEPTGCAVELFEWLVSGRHR